MRNLMTLWVIAILAALLMTSSAALAAGKGPQGQGVTHRQNVGISNGRTWTTPPGFNNNNAQRKGWNGGAVPPGWNSQGQRSGWNGGLTPPGINR